MLGTSLVALAAPTGATQSKIQPAIPSADDAPIAYMLDVTSGQVLFSREADRRFMPASITKVMTTFLAFEWMEEGRLFPEQVFTVRPETFQKWHRVGSTMFLPRDARVTVDELVHGVTTVSANDGAVVLAEGAAGSVEDWIAAMNAKAAQIGMRNSHFYTPNGWMDEGRTFTTARDLGTLAEAMLTRHPSKYKHFVGVEGLEYNGITQRNHDPISGVVPGADGIKTGFTNQAGFGFLGSAQRNGRRLVMVVAASPRARQRNDAARAFIEWGFAAFDTKRVFHADAVIAKARVQGAGVPAVNLSARGPVKIDVPRGTNPAITMAVRYEGPLQAPIAKGEEVAQLVVSIAGMPEHRVPLVAETDVLEATLLQRLLNGLTGWMR
ncbi:D-alanyl-D-alanine carboxypeptidase [Qipengyuania marisflavi]|uniref:serine-type D-Ala-D-Ala carboxypeptidase n=1 Tax=Qipengyuania marisflavi TaxID=2486356 RepID=A0A5S3PAD5_9SPHN|nr:D-alanyl-D-alanine carboxypeptidase [Qipengyuania marisflavi]